MRSHFTESNLAEIQTCSAESAPSEIHLNVVESTPPKICLNLTLQAPQQNLGVFSLVDSDRNSILYSGVVSVKNLVETVLTQIWHDLA